MMVKKTTPPIPTILIEEYIKEFLQADLQYGDVTSWVIPETASSRAQVISKSNGIIAGLQEATIIANLFQLNCTCHKQDGETIGQGDVILELDGNTRQILMMERLMLNIMMRMSSIATSTHSWYSTIKKNSLSTRIAATRKLTPGFAFFEKKAVLLGGGDTHRWSLSDMVLLKDTHLKYYKNNIHDLIAKARELNSFSKKIEIEVEKERDLYTAIDAGADIVMLDNLSPQRIKEILDRLEDKGLRRQIQIEASGNIDHSNYLEYAKSGVDILSSSEITLQPKIRVDLSLKLQ